MADAQDSSKAVDETGRPAEEPKKPARRRKAAPPDVLALTIIAGPASGNILGPFMTKKVTIGRTNKNNCHIDDPSVSERHAVLAWAGDQWTVADVGSTNGTRLNRKNLEGPSGRCKIGPALTLHDGDEIEFGENTRAFLEIRPDINETITVEEFLQQECDFLIARARHKGGLMKESMAEAVEALKTQILAAAQ